MKSFFRLIILAISLTSLCLSSVAQSEDNNYWTTTDTPNNYYFQVNAGLSDPSNPKGDFSGSFKKAGVYEAEIGYWLIENLRLGLNLAYRGKYDNNFTTVNSYENTSENLTDSFSYKTRSYSAMLTTSYDIYNFKGFTPYLVAGAGISQNITTGSYIETIGDADPDSYNYLSGKKNSFAYKAGIGGKINISKNMSLDIRYQYVNLGKISTGRSTTGVENTAIQPKTGYLSSHEALVGLSYKF